jgi:hypothetical protein
VELCNTNLHPNVVFFSLKCGICPTCWGCFGRRTKIAKVNIPQISSVLSHAREPSQIYTILDTPPWTDQQLVSYQPLHRPGVLTGKRVGFLVRPALPSADGLSYCPQALLPVAPTVDWFNGNMGIPVMGDAIQVC